MMLSNSNNNQMYINTKMKLKRLISQRTPTKVVIEINANVASNLTEIAMIESSIPSSSNEYN